MSRQRPESESRNAFLESPVAEYIRQELEKTEQEIERITASLLLSGLGAPGSVASSASSGVRPRPERAVEVSGEPECRGQRGSDVVDDDVHPHVRSRPRSNPADGAYDGALSSTEFPGGRWCQRDESRRTMYREPVYDMYESTPRQVGQPGANVGPGFNCGPQRRMSQQYGFEQGQHGSTHCTSGMAECEGSPGVGVRSQLVGQVYRPSGHLRNTGSGSERQLGGFSQRQSDDQYRSEDQPSQQRFTPGLGGVMSRRGYEGPPANQEFQQFIDEGNQMDDGGMLSRRYGGVDLQRPAGSQGNGCDVPMLVNNNYDDGHISDSRPEMQLSTDVGDPGQSGCKMRGGPAPDIGGEVPKEDPRPLSGGNDEGGQEQHPISTGCEQPVVTARSSDVPEQLRWKMMIDAMSMPKTSLMKFDGNPLEYWVFLQTFDTIVGKTLVDDGVKLSQLLNCCVGKAAKVLQPCALMEASAGYNRARKLLHERFGNDYVISEALVTRVTSGPGVKGNDGERLQELADDVGSCVETLRAMGRLDEIDTRARMVRIVARLPGYLQGRWRKMAVEAVDGTGKYPGIEKLSSFLQKTAREATDPVFGVHSFKGGERPQSHVKGSASFTVTATAGQEESCKTAAPVETKPKEAEAIVQSSSAPSGSSQSGSGHKGSAPSGSSQSGSGHKGSAPSASSESGSGHSGPTRKGSSQKGPAQNDQSRSDKVVKCFSCQGPHYLADCDQFKNKSAAERLKMVKNLRLCFNCLVTRSHGAYQCGKPSGCNRSGCQKKHSCLLHDALDQQSSTQRAKSCACTADRSGPDVALPVVRVDVSSRGQNESVRTLALLDPGSNRSFCSMSLLESLGMKGEGTSLELETLHDSKCVRAVEVTLDVTGVQGKKSTRKPVVMKKVYALENFPDLESCMGVDVSKWEHLRDLDLPQDEGLHVWILIGQDVPEALMPREVRKGADGEPYAVRTSLGWIVNGVLKESSDEGSGSQAALSAYVAASPSSSKDAALEEQVQQFWNLDTGQCLAGGVAQMSVEDRAVVKLWNDTVKVENGHYVLPIPFKGGRPMLPDNREVAEKRLVSLGRRLGGDQELLRRYKAEVDKMVEKGYAERVAVGDEGPPGGTWYLPHHCVLNPNKPGKCRVVFDCAAQYNGVSLNQSVQQGPDLVNKLLGVLMRFREGQVAVTGDVEAMYHQVKVPIEQRDALRFLWFRHGEVGQEVEVFRMTSHLFGGVWSPACANFAIKRAADEQRDKYDEEVVRTIMEDMYVDDCLHSEDDVSEVVNRVRDVSEVLDNRGFRIVEWMSNVKAVIEAMPKEVRAKIVRNLDLGQSELPADRALGVVWFVEADRLGVQVGEKAESPTRRGLLKVFSSVFDPLGMVCPVVLRAKLLFQAQCRKGKGWDEELDETGRRLWQKWLDELPLLAEFRIDRCLIPAEFGQVVTANLHHFADGSEEAYGTVSYLRVVNTVGRVHCVFVLGKSRLAPLKKMTVPRLELSAAVMAVRVDCMLRRELRMEVGESKFWSDSTSVIQYIRNTTHRFQTFVANRVAVIHDGSEAGQWNYVESELNPADDTSRGLSAKELMVKLRWLRGPEFLWQEECMWPTLPVNLPKLDDDKEVKKQGAKSCLVAAEKSDGGVDQLIERYSDFHRLRKAVAWIRRFLDWLKNGKPQEDARSLTVAELLSADVAIVKYVQRRDFVTELACLEKETTVSKKSSIYSLEPFLSEDGVIRVGGRLRNAPIESQAKHQMILPRDSHVAELVVRHVHESEAKHSGREYVLSLVRQRYWVPCIRPLINRVLRTCMVCKLLKGVPKAQRMADLPWDRVTPGKPAFSHVGLDCFGPFQVKRGRSTEKRYGCVFSCLSIRAVHIEMLDTLETSSFLNALMRFIARRGVPERIRSDNGTNFVAGERELREAMTKWNESKKTTEWLLLKGIVWQFNPPAASHMGGVWERQIRSIRKVLTAIVGSQSLDDERLRTLFCEVEGVINGRPLTAVSDNMDDVEPLTPNHLLLLRGSWKAPPGEFVKEDAYRRKWRHAQFLADQFWSRWVREYLPKQQLRPKWRESSRNLKEGDLVLLVDEVVQAPRRCWPLARVCRVFEGDDGVVRSAEIKTGAGVRLVRPVTKLSLLEATVED